MRNTGLPLGAKLAVRFLGRWQNYYRGDVATFPAPMSMRLVARGKAEPVNIAPLDAVPPPGAVLATRPPGETPRRAGQDEDLDF